MLIVIAGLVVLGCIIGCVVRYKAANRSKYIVISNRGTTSTDRAAPASGEDGIILDAHSAKAKFIANNSPPQYPR